ncbi:MAG: PDZ domain-containing protein [Turicibacter sp.]|nr:PDZ domain-containing protein [Turicibacter sp.]
MNNGHNPNEHYLPKPSQRKKRKIALSLLIIAVAFGAFAVFTNARQIEEEPTPPAYISTEQVTTEAPAVETATDTQQPNLTTLTPGNVNRANSHNFNIEEFNELSVSARFGAVDIRIIDTVDNIVVSSANSFEFSANNGILEIIAPNHADLAIWLPRFPNLPNHLTTPLFSDVQIEANFGYVQIIGQNNSYLTENLTITNPHNWIQLFDIQVSENMHLSANFGHVQLVAVTADPANLTTELDFGSMSVFETWQDFDLSMGTVRENITTRPSLGVFVEVINAEWRDRFSFPSVGLAIITVIENSPAAAAGLLPGDLIIAFNQAPITTVDELLTAISQSESGETSVVRIYRNGVAMDISVIMG